MSEQVQGWTSSQKVAHPFIQSAVSRGLTATEGLKQYRAGGGAIRDSSWFSVFKDEFGSIGTRENIIRIPQTYTVPDTMFTEKDFDLREKYMMQMKVSGYSDELDQRVTKWVSVSSSALITKAEWTYGAQEAVTDTLGSIPFQIDRVIEWDAVKRLRVRD